MPRYFWLWLIFAALAGNCALADTNVTITPETAWQGKVVRVQAGPVAGAKEVKAEFLGQKFPLYKNGETFSGIIGVPTNQKVGNYDLRLIITQSDNKIIERVKPVKVCRTKFPTTKYWLKPSRDKLRAREIIDNEWALIEKVLLKEEETKLWQGKFNLPSQGKISQGFGHLQVINGKRSGTHRGIDLAISVGAKVFAPNSGQVVFAQSLKAFGGTMVLDHGQGVHTLYFHLSKFAAEVGQNIAKGSLIAYSGNSGVSSGAHLHWGMSVHNLRVDPEQWVKYEM